MADPTKLEAVKARIRALRAKTAANGCTEAEALAAAEKAFALMREHGLDDDLVACAEGTAQLGRTRRSPIDAVLPTIAWVCHCRYYLRQDRVRGPLDVVFLGRDPWPEVALWLRGVVTEAADRALRDFLATPEYRRRRKPGTRSAARRHFLEGFVDVIRTKLRRLKALAGDGQAQQRDLALAEKALGSISLRTLDRLGAARGGLRFSDARSRGISAGCGVDLGWGVQRQPAPRAITQEPA
ncbi:MAG: DUF2786 domain-containing protein [Roseomonas mucosa]|nr:DUF2786 domain-containing protein [Roseomonas mucosa]